MKNIATYGNQNFPIVLKEHFDSDIHIEEKVIPMEYPEITQTELHKHLICDLRAKLLVACLVTPALWLNLTDSRNILIIHFGLLLKERTLDSIGHDLWKKSNVICLLWMICYISLLTNIFTQWILIDS